MLIRSLPMITLVALMPTLAIGQNCVEPPFTERYEFGGSLTDHWSATGCRLDAQLTGMPAGAATVHAARRDASEPLQMNFRIDLSELDGMNIQQQVSLASATSKLAVGEGSDAVADLFRVTVFGNLTGTGRILGVEAACANCPNQTHSTSTPLESEQPAVRVELDIGAGASGELRVWVDASPPTPATLVLADLDNAAWTGIDRLSVGLASASPAFLADFASVPVAFDQIGIGDSQYFWSGFEAEGAVCEGLPVHPHVYVIGDTCDGDNRMPTLASGSTRTRSPEMVYAFTLPEEGSKHTLSIESQVPGLAAFACREFCGPAVRCLGAATPGVPLLTDSSWPPGDYRIVVTSTDIGGVCGSYELGVLGPLD